MTTRLSKIARLPATIREQLNRRLHDGELGRTILPWVNNLPKTKKVLADIFNGKPITHQNLSEWRASGFQDWTFHQHRIHWFSRLHEEDTELEAHDNCGDTYEAISRFFLFEIGQAMQAAQKIKNPDARWAKIEPLTEKFARLQNAFNWSRRTQLEFDKYNHQFEPDEPCEIEPPHELPKAGGVSVLASRAQTEAEHEDPTGIEPEKEEFIDAEEVPNQKREGAGALQDAPRNSEAVEQRASPASAGDCGSPRPLSNEQPEAPISASRTEPERETENAATQPSYLPPPTSEIHSTPNSQPPTKCHPIPTPAPTTPINLRVIQQTNAIRTTRNLYTRTRGRGFTCIEG